MPTSSPEPPTDSPTDDAPTKYARAVVEGKVLAGRLVKLACQRHLTDLDEGHKRGLRYSPKSAAYALSFFNYLRHSKGEWSGRQFRLEPWQKFVIGCMFGWKRRDGTRRFRTVYLEIARKNGKSLTASGIGLYGLIADHEAGAEVYSAATKKDQARLIFDESVRMVTASPELLEIVDRYKYNLSVRETFSKFEPLSADAKSLDGLNPSLVLIDELHAHPNRSVVDVLDTAMGSRRQPLLVIITTAGDDNPESVYATENDYAQKVLDGIVVDDGHLAYIATLDEGDRWDNPAVWGKANPNLGVSVKLDDLKRQALKAKNSPTALVAFKRLRLNVRTADATRAIAMEVWRQNGGPRIDPAALAGRRCYGGLDLSSKLDLSSFTLLFPPRTPEERFQIVSNHWIPADTMADKSDRDQVQYRLWVEAGYIEATPGNVIDHEEIGRAVLEANRLYEIEALAYDPWNSAQLATGLQHEGVRMFEFVQGVRSYTAPTKELLAKLTERRLDHGNNPVLAWMASNLAVQTDKNENMMPTKKHSRGRIDGMTSLIMALGRWLLAEGPSVLETRGLMVIGGDE